MLKIGKFLINNWAELERPWRYYHCTVSIDKYSWGSITIHPKFHQSMALDKVNYSVWRIDFNHFELNKLHKDMFGDISELRFISSDAAKEYINKFFKKLEALKAFI